MRGHNPEAKLQQQEQAGISPGKALQTIEQYQKDPKNSSKKVSIGRQEKQNSHPYTSLHCNLTVVYRTPAKLPKFVNLNICSNK